MKKRLLALVMAVAMVAGLTACGSSKAEDAGAATAGTAGGTGAETGGKNGALGVSERTEGKNRCAIGQIYPFATDSSCSFRFFVG